ncbi:hypothetical protein SDC9_74164 [bioreactor metagenome]|uniref:Uncharacterized protein n=1 Tax=bioreactor metagenome TaxID=1076179 RepID=A0A644YID8_9ZZZZ
MEKCRFKTGAALALLILLLSLGASSTSAQNSIHDPNRVIVKQQPEVKPTPTEVSVEVSTPENITEKKEEVPALPYVNYKGISDPDQAKAEWVRENPEEYQKLQQPANAEQKVQQKAPVSEKRTVVKPSDAINDGSEPKDNQ